MQKDIEISRCRCPESKSPLKPTKYYHEIEAEVIGNKLLIRVEKDKNKRKKKHSSEWDPSCNYGSIPEIIRPTRTQGPRIVNIDDDNQIIFRINSKSQIKCEDPNYRPTIMKDHLRGSSHSGEEQTLMVYPQLEGDGTQEIYRDHVTVGNQNIFMMRIKKKSNAKEHQNRNIELEVTYPNISPRHITPPSTPPLSTPLPLPVPPSSPPLTEPEINVSKSFDANSKKLVKSRKGKKGKKKKKMKKKKT